MIAAPWDPDPSLAGPSGHVEHEYLWAALDCPSGFALVPLPDGLGIVLGELCASVVRDVSPGDTLVVAAWAIGVNGRKRFSGSAIYTADGTLVAKARATWIEIPLSQW
jgi:acyl-CoA thioesterase FadM